MTRRWRMTVVVTRDTGIGQLIEGDCIPKQDAEVESKLIGRVEKPRNPVIKTRLLAEKKRRKGRIIKGREEQNPYQTINDCGIRHSGPLINTIIGGLRVGIIRGFSVIFYS